MQTVIDQPGQSRSIGLGDPIIKASARFTERKINENSPVTASPHHTPPDSQANRHPFN